MREYLIRAASEQGLCVCVCAWQKERNQKTVLVKVAKSRAQKRPNLHLAQQSWWKHHVWLRTKLLCVGKDSLSLSHVELFIQPCCYSTLLVHRSTNQCKDEFPPRGNNNGTLPQSHVLLSGVVQMTTCTAVVLFYSPVNLSVFKADLERSALIEIQLAAVQQWFVDLCGWEGIKLLLSSQLLPNWLQMKLVHAVTKYSQPHG